MKLKEILMAGRKEGALELGDVTVAHGVNHEALDSKCLATVCPEILETHPSPWNFGFHVRIMGMELSAWQGLERII